MTVSHFIKADIVAIAIGDSHAVELRTSGWNGNGQRNLQTLRYRNNGDSCQSLKELIDDFGVKGGFVNDTKIKNLYQNGRLSDY